MLPIFARQAGPPNEEAVLLAAIFDNPLRVPPMPLRATLRDDNTLELSEDAPRLARTNTPLHVIDLGGGTFVVTEHEPQIPDIASEFRDALADTGVTTEELLENLDAVKQKRAEEGQS
jgi:hypothetical protein